MVPFVQTNSLTSFSCFRAEEFMGYFDVRRKFVTNPSDKLKPLE